MHKIFITLLLEGWQPCCLPIKRIWGSGRWARLGLVALAGVPLTCCGLALALGGDTGDPQPTVTLMPSPVSAPTDTPAPTALPTSTSTRTPTPTHTPPPTITATPTSQPTRPPPTEAPATDAPTPRPTSAPTATTAPVPTNPPSPTPFPTPTSPPSGGGGSGTGAGSGGGGAYDCSSYTACGNWSTCQQAHDYLNACPGYWGRADGDSDGVPCENVCPGG